MQQAHGFLALSILSASFAVFAQTNDAKPGLELTAATVAAVAPMTSAACCQQLSKQPAVALPRDKAELKLDEKSPTYDFGQGLQSYLLLELPAYSEPYSFNIRNLPQAPGWYNKGNHTHVALRIETLDADFQSKRVYKHDGMKKRGLGFEKTVFINPQNQAERYVLVYGTLNLEPETVTVSQRDVMFVGTGFYLGGADNKLTLKAIDNGVIIVEAKLPEKK